MFAVWTFSVALIALIGLFSLKWWEFQSGKRLFADVRRKADVFVVEHAPQLHKHTVRQSKHISKKAAISFLHFISVSALHIVRLLERRLVGLVDMIRGRHSITERGEASNYLKQVSEHRKVNGRKEKNNNLSE